MVPVTTIPFAYREVGVRGIAAVGSLAGGIHQFAVGGIQFFIVVYLDGDFDI